MKLSKFVCGPLVVNHCFNQS